MSTSSSQALPAPATEPVAPPAQRLDHKQYLLRKELCAEYGFESSEVFFDGNKPDPYFTFTALSLMVLKLAPEFHVVSITRELYDDETNIFTSYAMVGRTDGVTREMSGHAMQGELLPSGELIRSKRQGFEVSSVRAVRKALRAMGFDPMTAHRLRMHTKTAPVAVQAETHSSNSIADESGTVVPAGSAIARNADAAEEGRFCPVCGVVGCPNTHDARRPRTLLRPRETAAIERDHRLATAQNIITAGACPGCHHAWTECRCNAQPATTPLTPNQIRTNSVKEVHALGETLGLIKGDDKGAWERALSLWFNGRTSTVELDQDELGKLAMLLRDLERGMREMIEAKRNSHFPRVGN